MNKLIFPLVLICLVLMGCMQVRVEPQSSEALDELLSGQLLFGETVGVEDISTDSILALDEEMRAYVQSKVENRSSHRSRLRNLLTGMVEDGLLDLDYNPNLTKTASETFHSRQGNCLSFSNLFVALAREADLDVSFQIVMIPPNFSTDGGLVVLNNHINILVKGIRKNRQYIQDYVVDFNSAEYIGNYNAREVSDDYAVALYFSNLAVESIYSGRARDAFRFLKKAINTYPELPDLWVNLGVLYSRQLMPETAVVAYYQALSIQASNKSALVNIAGALEFLGRHEEADYYRKQATYYRDHNPYYHYLLGQRAYQEGRYGDVLTHLDEAIKLRKDEHKFYYLEGLAYQKLQLQDLAMESFKKARNAAKRDQLVAAYERKLQALEDRPSELPSH